MSSEAGGLSLMDAALQYAQRGWRVFPLAPGSKIPWAGSAGFKDATNDEDQIRRWWTDSPDSNIGIATGSESGLVVIDVDTKGNVDGTEAAKNLGVVSNVIAQTPTRGRHYYFQYPIAGGKFKSNVSHLARGIDVRADGGYVVAAPSKLPNGIYTWLEDGKLAPPLPQSIASRLTLPTTVRQIPQEGIPEGERNNTLFGIGRAVRDQQLSQDQVLAALLCVNQTSCKPPLSETEVGAITASIFTQPAGEAGTKEDLLNIVRKANGRLFTDCQQKAFAEFDSNGHRELWPLKSEHFRTWIANEYYKASKKVPSDIQITAAVSALIGRARFDSDSEQIEVFLRVAAGKDGRYYLDLANEDWQVVEISAEGWSIVSNPPVKFRRTANMLPLPRPEGGGSIRELLDVINVAKDDFPLVVAVLVNALRGKPPFPVLELVGEQGSAKSTTQKFLRRLIDPNRANVRGKPGKNEDIYVAAENNFVISYDNVSHLLHEQQDTLSQISTGSGSARRQLYTDGDEVVIKAERPVILSAIGNVVTNGDLADRTISLELPQITSTTRRTEDDLQRLFTARHAKLLGALLDLMVKALRELPNVKLEQRPRLADFAHLGEAVSRVANFEQFLPLFERKRKDSAQIAIESSPVASAVMTLARQQPHWEGTVLELLNYISQPHFRSDGEGWVKSARGLRDALQRAKPELARWGVTVDLSRRSNKGRMVSIDCTACQPSRSSPPSQVKNAA